jgi:hypothetical protein
MIHQVFSPEFSVLDLKKPENRFGTNAVATSTSYFNDYINTLLDP